MSHTIAIFPGSFDPFTRGHQALVDDALRIFDKVVIGIGNNVSRQDCCASKPANNSSKTSMRTTPGSK